MRNNDSRAIEWHAQGFGKLLPALGFVADRETLLIGKPFVIARNSAKSHKMSKSFACSNGLA